MAGNNIYKNHPYGHPTNVNGQTNTQYGAYSEMVDYMNGAKHTGSIGKTMIEMSKHGMNMDNVNGMRR